MDHANPFDTIRPIRWVDDHLQLLDQRLLPASESYLAVHTAEQAATAITDMVVRGAPAIGITAAYGVLLSARQHADLALAAWKSRINDDIARLRLARPTAVNLAWALDQMAKVLEVQSAKNYHALARLAVQIHEDDIVNNHRMGEIGADLFEKRERVLTHCNAGALATGGYGTALGVVRSAFARDKLERVFADETRPWLQGARLTAWELMKDQIPVSLIADGAASHIMRSENIAWVIVGADRVAANGDVANKIGTYGLAIAARYHGIRFMVVAPTSTVDLATPTGDQIPIENRHSSELLTLANRALSPVDAKAVNPVFDVTPASLVDVLVTEKGAVFEPNAERIHQLFLDAQTGPRIVD